MNDEQRQLNEIRQQIDQIDQQLLTSINQRASLVQTVGKIKQSNQQQPVVFRPERESQILQQLIKQNPGPLNQQQISDIFRAILAVGRTLQQSLSISFLGPLGTFSHAAVLQYFGNGATLVPQSNMEDILKSTLQDKSLYGIIPIENSTEGVVNSSLDALVGIPLKACGEIVLPIHQHLLVNPKHAASEIKKIYSHSQSLAQCHKWLIEHLPNAETIAVASNAKAAEQAYKEPGSAAIAGELAAAQYGLKIVHEKIEDDPENSTRFLIMGKQDIPPSGNDKTLLFIGVVNKPGSLLYLIQPFAKRNINITLPVSRPLFREKWQYIFYFEIDGHQQNENIQQALAELQQHITSLQILGSYPKVIT